MTVTVRLAAANDAAALAALRRALWPDGPGEPGTGTAAFLAHAPDGTAIGFAEASVRHDYVNGCDSSPVAFLEGLYVAPERRRRGVARALVAAVAGWARARGMAELASDALADNGPAHAAHRALGFAEAERVVFFRQAL